MFTSSRQFPEFQGKDRDYQKACTKFISEKEPRLARIFLLGVFGAMAFSVISTLCIALLPVPRFIKENETMIGASMVGGGFYLFLLVHINVYVYPAVKKHIAEFEATRKNG